MKPALPTVPMSPAFALKNRVRLPVEVPEEKVMCMFVNVGLYVCRCRLAGWETRGTLCQGCVSNVT